MTRGGAAAGLALLLLASCAAPQAAAGPARRFAAENPVEAALLARYPRSVRREGNVLRVASRGGWLDYSDTDCEADAETCISYTVDQAWQNGRFIGIAVGLYEGGDYLVADTQSGHEYTGDVPLFAPNGIHFASAAFNEVYETSAEGVRVWTADPVLREIRVISARVLTYPEALTWLGDSCLRFTAVPLRPGELFGDPQNRRTFHLVAAEPEWRLLDAPAAGCRD